MLIANTQKRATDIHTNVNALLLEFVNMDIYGIGSSANALNAYDIPVHQDTTLIMVFVDV